VASWAQRVCLRARGTASARKHRVLLSVAGVCLHCGSWVT
jgi:hypothetical protein